MEWDRATVRYQLDRDHIIRLKEIKSQLLADTARARSVVSDIAREVNFFAVELENILSFLAPKGDYVAVLERTGEKLPAITKRIKEVVDAGGDVLEVSRGGVDQLVDFYSRESAHRAELGRIWAAKDILVQIVKRQELIVASEDLKDTVREQVARIDEELRKFQAASDISKQRIEGINTIHNAISSACNQFPVPVAPPE